MIYMLLLIPIGFAAVGLWLLYRSLVDKERCFTVLAVALLLMSVFTAVICIHIIDLSTLTYYPPRY